MPAPDAGSSAPLHIRRAERGDAETLARFNEAMARETEGKALEAATVRAGVEGLFERPEHGFYLVAERAGRPVGTLMITTEWSDWRAGLFWWIQSVYVRPEARRQGVYRALYAHVRREAARAEHVRGLRLYVERENAAARATYRTLGMKETRYRMFEELL